jgi:PhnB protein
MNQANITSIAPWLSVRSSKQALAFYKAAFDAIETYRLEDDDGNAVVKLVIGSAEFWLSDTVTDNDAPEKVGGDTIRIILTVDDPDAVFAKAIDAGATAIFSVSEEHSWRIGRIVDPFGLHWEIGKQVGIQQ